MAIEPGTFSISDKPVTELLTWFRQFWEFSEQASRNQELASRPLLRVRENWDYWWQARLSEEERERITELASLAEREDFVAGIETLIRGKYRLRGAVNLVFWSLARIPLLHKLVSSRHADMKGANAIILQDSGKGCPGDIKPLFVMSIPREANSPRYELLNLDLDNAALEKVWDATLSLLSGTGLSGLLLLRGLSGWKPRRPMVRFPLLIFRVMAGLILLVLLFAAPLAEDYLVLALQALVVAISVLLLDALVGNIREIYRAQKWADLLKESQLCVLAGNLEEDVPVVEGSSFGVALCLSILLALEAENPADPEKSWLWGRFFTQLKEASPSWDFTGSIRGSGWLKRVRRLPDKVDASCLHFSINDMVTPVQETFRPFRVSRFEKSVNCVAGAGQAADASELRVHHYWHFVQVILKVGNFVNGWSILGNILLLSLVLTVCAALPDICQNIFPSPRLELKEVRKTGLPDEGILLELYFTTQSPEAFFVDMKSDYYCNRRLKLERSESKGPDYAVARIYLVKCQLPRSLPGGEIEIHLTRRLLWRRLPDKIVLAMPLS